MKRGWIGLILLGCLLLGGVLSSRYMTREQETLAQAVEAAAQDARAGQWESACRRLRETRHAWNRGWKKTAVFADHAPMEEINGLFAQLEVYGRRREILSFSAACAELKCQLEAMADAHKLSWENLL